MRERQGSVLAALRRTKNFLDANGEMFAAVNKSSARRKLEEIAEQLAAHGVSQEATARGSIGETTRQRTLRAALRRDHMRPIAAVAKEKLRGVPEFDALRMPRPDLSVETLVVAARGMAGAAKPHSKILIENGLQDDFIDQLLSVTSALEKSIGERDTLRDSRAGSTAGLDAEERRGRVILRVLDGVVRPKIGDDDILLARWRTAKQVGQPRSVVPTTPPTPAVTPPDAPSPQPVPAALPAAEVTLAGQEAA